MRYLKTNTAVIVTVGPFYDKTDGVTIKGALTITNERITLTADTDAGSAPTVILNNITGATAATANDLNYLSTSAGLMQLELAAADVNRLGRMFLTITDAANHAPVFHEFEVLPANVYDSMFGDTGVGMRANLAGYLGTAVPTADTAGYPKVTLKSGAGTGELSLTSGNVALTTAGINAVADQVWDEATSGHVAAGSYGAVLFVIRSATAQAGSGATTIRLDAGASGVVDFYKNQAIFIVSGTGVGQGRIISAYDQTTKDATVSTWNTTPDGTSVFVITPFGSIPGASAPTAAENADAVWDEVMSGHTTEASYGALMQSRGLHVGTAQAGSSSSITLDATGVPSSSGTNDAYKYQFITIRSGTGIGQTRQISAYDGTTKVATVSLAWVINPVGADSEYVLHPGGFDAATVASVSSAVWNEARASHIAAGSFGEYVIADVQRINANATSADNADAFFNGTGYAGTGNVIPTVTTVTGVTTVNGLAAGVITAASIAADAITDAKVAADVTIASVTGSVGSVAGNVVGSVGSVAGNVSGNVVGSVGSVAGNVTLGPDSVTAAVLAADAVTEIQAGLATAATLTAVKAKTDSLTFTIAGMVDSNLQRVNDVLLVGDGSATPWGP